VYSLTNNPHSSTSNIGFFVVRQFLCDSDIDYLNRWSQSKKLIKGSVEDDESPHDFENRDCSILWIRPESDNEKIKNIFEKIKLKIIEVNRNVFQYNLTDIEPIQYTRYYTGNFYVPHVDTDRELFMANWCRKLSFSIQLSESTNYEGGDLLAFTGGEPIIACREKGSMTFFPSFMLHEVKPVTHGVRNALVGWCWGPKFK